MFHAEEAGDRETLSRVKEHYFLAAETRGKKRPERKEENAIRGLEAFCADAPREKERERERERGLATNGSISSVKVRIDL